MQWQELITFLVYMQLACFGGCLCNAQPSSFDDRNYSSMDMQAPHAALASCTCCSSMLRLSIAAARSARSAKSLQRMQLVLLLDEIRPYSKGIVLLHEGRRLQTMEQTCASKLVVNQRRRIMTRGDEKGGRYRSSLRRSCADSASARLFAAATCMDAHSAFNLLSRVASELAACQHAQRTCSARRGSSCMLLPLCVCTCGAVRAA